jgi:hypothetical protein
MPWICANIGDRHAEDRTEEDAIRELYMNAFDGAEAAGTPDDVSIKAEDGTIKISNPTKAKFLRRHMLVGRSSKSPSDTKKMGRHSLGLKDAIAVLLGRSGWNIELTACGQQVLFEFRDVDGDNVLHWCHGEQGAQADEWVFTITVDSSRREKFNTSELVQNVESDFTLPTIDQVIVEHMGVKVLKPNTEKKGKPKCFRHKQAAKKKKKLAGMYIGRRFVRFGSDSTVSYFGYHVTSAAVTDEIKKLISRDQVLATGLTAEDPLRKLLRKVFTEKSEELKPHLPAKLCRELVFFSDDSRPEEGSAPRTESRSKVANSDRGQIAEPVEEIVQSSGHQVVPVWKWASPAAKAWYDVQRDLALADDSSSTAKLLIKLNTCAQKAFPGCSAQVVPYGSIIYQVCVCVCVWVGGGGGGGGWVCVCVWGWVGGWGCVCTLCFYLKHSFSILPVRLRHETSLMSMQPSCSGHPTRIQTALRAFNIHYVLSRR